MKQFLEAGGGLLLTGSLTGLGVLARVVLLSYYSLLGHACRRLHETKNKTVRKMKDGLRKRLEKGNEIRSISVYTEHCMAEQRLAGLRVGVWENVSMQTILLATLTGSVGALGGILWECKAGCILEQLFAVGGSVLLLLTLELVFGISEKRKRVRLCLREYMENVWLPEAALEEQETVSVHSAKRELRKAKREEKKKAGAAMAEKKRKKAKKKRCKAQEEKRRLTEELLRERRMLEARQLTEQKRNESAVPESPEKPAADEKEQAVAEAAATDISYESLLRNVLSEYLA